MQTVSPPLPCTHVFTAIGSNVRPLTISSTGGTLISGTVTLVPVLDAAVGGTGVEATVGGAIVGVGGSVVGAMVAVRGTVGGSAAAGSPATGCRAAVSGAHPP